MVTGNVIWRCWTLLLRIFGIWYVAPSQLIPTTRRVLLHRVYDAVLFVDCAVVYWSINRFHANVTRCWFLWYGGFSARPAFCRRAVEACYYDLTREKKDTIIFGLHANKLDTKAIVVGQSIPSLPSCFTPYRRSKLKWASRLLESMEAQGQNGTQVPDVTCSGAAVLEGNRKLVMLLQTF